MASKEDLILFGVGQRFTSTWILIPYCILIYDHLLSLNTEIKYIWRKPKRTSFFLFVVLRYSALAINTGMIFLRFGSVPLEQCVYRHLFPADDTRVATFPAVTP
ncbi:hypothetical protein R3P38DRAFT_1187779 [Favolaschia claudopus]|uniref:DUF6533 domain-containing protein n=1 Tax=Favolaschia claudopus TaxID=2862362 RepID=A0AAW0E1V2_9AGAR